MIFQIIEKKIFIKNVCLNKMIDEYNFVILKKKKISLKINLYPK